jgi:hypothetical protein
VVQGRPQHVRNDQRRGAGARDGRLPGDSGPPERAAGRHLLRQRPAWQASTNGWGPAERDRSNGEQGVSDGRPITIGGTGFAKGIGAHAAGTVDVFLGGRCSTFTADVGRGREVGTNGSVTFSVLGDGTVLTTTGVRRGGQAAQRLSVTITGRTVLRLTVADGGDNINFDHADWANAQLTCS